MLTASRLATLKAAHPRHLDLQECVAEIERLQAENATLRTVLRGGDVKDGPEGVGVLAPNIEYVATLLGVFHNRKGLCELLRQQAKLIREALTKR